MPIVACYFQRGEEYGLARVIERVEGCYETQEVPFGRVYVWRPGHLLIECDCGERVTFTGSASVCACGVDHTATLREGLASGRSGDRELHPWRYARDREGTGLPF